jgi:hypothetical protein
MINLIESCIIFKQVYRETPFVMKWISHEKPKNRLSRSMDFMHETAICNFLLPLGRRIPSCWRHCGVSINDQRE